jgi:hypothetical protein
MNGHLLALNHIEGLELNHIGVQVRVVIILNAISPSDVIAMEI